MSNKKRYFIMLITLLGLVVINQSIIQYFLNTKKDDAKIINIAGKQRMLSQQVALFSYQTVHTNDKSISLGNTIQNWKKSHYSLLKGDPKLNISGTNDDKIYNKLKSTLDNILEIESIYVNNPSLDKYELDYINQSVEQFLPQMDEIVRDYETISDQKLDNIILLEIILAIITIALIILEYLFIIRPIHVKLTSQNKILKDIAWRHSHDLRKPVANILGLTQLLKDDKEIDSVEKETLLQHVYDATKELDDVVRDIVEKTNQK